MVVARRRWPAAAGKVRDLYGRVWTDLEDLTPWVVLLQRPTDWESQREREPKLVFRRVGQEFTLPVSRDVHLEELDDRRLRGYLHLARAG